MKLKPRQQQTRLDWQRYRQMKVRFLQWLRRQNMKSETKGLLLLGLLLFSVMTIASVMPPTNSTPMRLRRLASEATALAVDLELQASPPLPVSPAHAVASTNTPIPRMKHRIEHPSGAIIDITMPTNQAVILIPEGFTLEKLHVTSVSLDAFADIKRTNTGAAIYYFVPK